MYLYQMKTPAQIFKDEVDNLIEAKLNRALNTYNSGYVQALHDLEELIEKLIFDERDHFDLCCEMGQVYRECDPADLMDKRYKK
jgi:hypothetical protein